MIGRFIRRVRTWFTGGHAADLRAELELHRALTQERLERGGLPAAEAAGASRRAMGNLTLAREDARAVWVPLWLEHARQDARYACRIMRKHPLFASAVVLIMTLGIGTTTTVFSIVDSLVLKPLPVHEPDRLVWFGSPSFSYPVFQDVQSRGSQIFSSVAAWDIDDVHVDWGGGVESTQVLLASGNFHATLGVRAVAGRTFDAADDDGSGGRHGPVAVISYACWQRRFGGAASALGRTIRIERVPFTIVGVTPRGFFGVAPGLAPEITIPLTTIVRLRPEERDMLQSGSDSWLHLIARLQPEMSLARANVLLEPVWRAVLEAAFPAGMDRRTHFLARRTTLEPGRTGFSRVRRQFAAPLWMLLGLVMLLLLVACASAANLLLARTLARRRELAIRLAIGAGRGRIVRQLLTEAAISIALGAAAAFVFTTWANRALVALLATRQEPVALALEADWRIFTFTVGLAIVATAIVALSPAIRASQLGPARELKLTGQISGAGLARWTSGKLLVTCQVALTVLLLAGAALFVRSLLRVLGEESGFERQNLLVVRTDPFAAGYDDRRATAFYTELVERLARLPGVSSAALSLYPPISDEDGAWTEPVAVNGMQVSDDPNHEVYLNVVSPTYLRTLGMRVLQGRDLDPRDGANVEPVVLINASFARRLFADGAAMGRRIGIGRGSRQEFTIVGVVQDAKYQTLQEPARGIAYLPEPQARQRIAGESLFAVVRAPTAVRTTADAIRREIVAMEPDIPVHVEQVADRIRDSLVRERAIATVAVAVGITALVLACAALYGLMAYAVSTRTGEIGVRLAFGAARSSVLWMVLRDAIALGGFGIVAGLAAALLLGRFTRSLLYQISPADPISLGAAAVVMLFVAAAAGLLPARRAANVDPVVALRE